MGECFVINGVNWRGKREWKCFLRIIGVGIYGRRGFIRGGVIRG